MRIEKENGLQDQLEAAKYFTFMSTTATNQTVTSRPTETISVSRCPIGGILHARASGVKCRAAFF
jgi:hypothetical protein